MTEPGHRHTDGQSRGRTWTRAAQGPARGDAGTSRGRTWTRTAELLGQPRRHAAVAAISLFGLLAGAAPALAATDHTGSFATAQQHVILRLTPGASNAVSTEVTQLGGTVVRALSLINALDVKIDARALGRLRRDPHVLSATPNAAVHMLATTYDPSTDPNSLYSDEQIVGNRTVWNKYTGKGVDVALLDSGVTRVPGLSDPGKVVYGPDLTPESQNASTQNLDTYGHGTHMAGIIAGHDSGVIAATNTGNKTVFLGAAPDARIVSVKAADAHGNSDVSQIIAGIAWVVQHAKDPGYNIRVLNLSFGTDSAQSYQLDPLAFAVEAAWRSGIVVVVSAGNSGSADGRLTNPAMDPFVIAVAADNTNSTSSVTDDTIPAFSSRGNGTRNPDIAAPGTHVQSLRVPGSYIDTQYGSTGALDSRFFRGSGTSQAAAFVSGSLAQLAQQWPAYTPDQFKNLLTGTALKLPAADVQAQGAGMVNMRGATGTYKPALYQKSWTRSTGTGSLNAARGGAQLLLDGVTLNTEQDIFGQPFNATAMASAVTAGTSWSGGTWNGTDWTGSTWLNSTTWAGRTWAGRTWAGGLWSGRTWATGTWDGRTWASTNWNGLTWTGSSWSGRTWAGRTWADDSWS